MRKLLAKYTTLFSSTLTVIKGVRHRIKLSDDRPFVQKAYPIPIAYKSLVQEKIEEMLTQGIIKKEKTAYINPLLVVKKKDGGIRLCLDARRLNSITIPENDVPPRIDDILLNFYGAKYFSSIDFTASYWQIELHPEDRKYTGFLFNSCSYVFQRVAFGLKNSGAALIRCLDDILGPELKKCLTVYVDDILVASSTFPEHLTQLSLLFETLLKANVSINLSKSQFCCKEIKFLGHILSGKGVRPSPEKISAIETAPPPVNVKQLRAFLGLCNFYVKFVQKYSFLTLPLLRLLKKGTPWKWEEAQDKAFKNMKQCFLDSVMLGFSDFSRKIFVQTDSSDLGLGAVIFQKD